MEVDLTILWSSTGYYTALLAAGQLWTTGPHCSPYRAIQVALVAQGADLDCAKATASVAVEREDSMARTQCTKHAGRHVPGYTELGGDCLDCHDTSLGEWERERRQLSDRLLVIDSNLARAREARRAFEPYGSETPTFRCVCGRTFPTNPALLEHMFRTGNEDHFNIAVGPTDRPVRAARKAAAAGPRREVEIDFENLD